MIKRSKKLSQKQGLQEEEKPTFSNKNNKGKAVITNQGSKPGDFNSSH